MEKVIIYVNFMMNINRFADIGKVMLIVFQIVLIFLEIDDVINGITCIWLYLYSFIYILCVDSMYFLTVFCFVFASLQLLILAWLLKVFKWAMVINKEVAILTVPEREYFTSILGCFSKRPTHKFYADLSISGSLTIIQKYIWQKSKDWIHLKVAY